MERLPEVWSKSDCEVAIAAVEFQHVMVVAPLCHLPSPLQHLLTHASVRLTERPFDLQKQRHAPDATRPTGIMVHTIRTLVLHVQAPAAQVCRQ